MAENDPAKICRLISDFLNLLSAFGLPQRTPYDYGVVDFPNLHPTKLNFSEVFVHRQSLLFVVMRLVDLFPPQILERFLSIWTAYVSTWILFVLSCGGGLCAIK